MTHSIENGTVLPRIELSIWNLISIYSFNRTFFVENACFVRSLKSISFINQANTPVADMTSIYLDGVSAVLIGSTFERSNSYNF